MTDWRCVDCHLAYAGRDPGRICADCRRHRAVGVLVGGILQRLLTWRHPDAPYLLALDELDAVAQLLGVVTKMRRQHNRELRDESRSAQRDANAAYSEGVNEGRSQSRW